MSTVNSDQPKVKVCRKCGRDFMGKKCNPCHAEYMRAWSAANPEKRRLSSKTYSDKNKEKVKLSRKIYNDANRERNRVGAKNWYEQNIDRAKESRRQWRQKNVLKIKEYNRAYVLKNWERHSARSQLWLKNRPELRRLYVMNRRAKIRSNGGELSKDIAQRLMRAQASKCACCSICLKKSGYHLDHIIPVAAGGPNLDSNIQLLCPSCNHSKGSKDPIRFMQSRGFLL